MSLENTCPDCGSPLSYVGLSSIECSNPACARAAEGYRWEDVPGLGPGLKQYNLFEPGGRRVARLVVGYVQSLGGHVWSLTLEDRQPDGQPLWAAWIVDGEFNADMVKSAKAEALSIGLKVLQETMALKKAAAEAKGE